MFKIQSLVMIVAACVGGGFAPAAVAVDKPAGPPTRVTPHMDVAIVEGENIVYCATFQIAWNDMKQNIVGEDIRLDNPPDMVRFLNRSLSTKADVNERDYFARAGAGSDEFIDGLNRDLVTKFGKNAPRIGDVYRAEDIILAYAFLKKSMEFSRPFEKFAHPVSFFAGGHRSNIQGFGIFAYAEEQHGVYRDQVEVIDQNDADDFIVRLRSLRPDDEIILANVPHGTTLLETYKTVRTRVEGSTPTRLASNDVLMIPMLDVRISHSYDSLVGLNVLNEGWDGWFVHEARQDILFRMDERGVAVDSQAKLAFKKGPAMNRLLMFDDPYMLYIKTRDGEYPYFAIWVGNAGLLVKGDQRS